MRVYRCRCRKTDWTIDVRYQQPGQSYATHIRTLRVRRTTLAGYPLMTILDEATLFTRRLLLDATGSDMVARDHARDLARAYQGRCWGPVWIVRQEDLIAWVDERVPIGSL